jgi:hypothetical protein
MHLPPKMPVADVIFRGIGEEWGNISDKCGEGAIEWMNKMKNTQN